MYYLIYISICKKSPQNSMISIGTMPNIQLKGFFKLLLMNSMPWPIL